MCKEILFIIQLELVLYLNLVSEQSYNVLYLKKYGMGRVLVDLLYNNILIKLGRSIFIKCF